MGGGGMRYLWKAWTPALLLVAAAMIVPVALACGGDDDDDSGGSGAADNEPQLIRLADRAEADAIGAGGGKFRDTGFMLYCRQNSGYEGSVFEAIGFQPEGSQAKDEYCYNVSDDRLKLALSRRAASSGKGACLVLTMSGGAVTRSDITTIGDSDPCRP